MVNFAVKLSSNIVVAWSAYYVNYNKLKRLIKSIKNAQRVRAAQETERQRVLDIAAVTLPEAMGDKRQTGATDNTTQKITGVSTNVTSGSQEQAVGLPPLPTSRPTKPDDTVIEATENDPLLLDGDTTDGRESVIFRKESDQWEIGPESQPLRQSRLATYGSVASSTGSLMSLSAGVNPIQEYEHAIQREIRKVEKFYLSELDVLNQAMQEIRISTQHIDPKDFGMDLDEEEDTKELSKTMHKIESIKRSYINLYQKVTLLKNYAILNYTAFVKIAKKHKKVTGLESSKHHMELVNQTKFRHAKEVQQMMDAIETYVANAFFHGDTTLGRSELLMKSHHSGDLQMLHAGMRAGIVLVLLVWVIWDSIITGHGSGISPQVHQVFRGFSCFVMAYWLWAFNIYIWNNSHINYIYLFEFDPRRSAHPMDIIFRASSVTFVFLVSVLLFTKVSHGEFHGIPPVYAMYIPFALFLYMASVVFFPWGQQKLLVTGMVSVLTAPFSQVTFFSAFIGDLLTSAVKPMVDVAFATCFFFSGEWQQEALYIPNKKKHDSSSLLTSSICQESPTFKLWIVPIVTSLPLWFRFAQNLRRYYDTRKRRPHLVNASKYALAFSLVLFGSLHPEVNSAEDQVGLINASPTIQAYRVCFVLALILSTTFTFCWDVLIDWGLATSFIDKLRCCDDRDASVSPKAGSGPVYPLLRDRLMYPRRWWYYCAVAGDLFLRFTWSLTLIPNLSHLLGNYAYILAPGLAWIELARRAIWCLFRVENEHLNNTQGYRRVDIVPLLFETQSNDGAVIKRNKRQIMLELAAFVGLVLTLAVLSFATRPNEEVVKG